jgi:hypothetical protein
MPSLWPVLSLKTSFGQTTILLVFQHFLPVDYNSKLSAGSSTYLKLQANEKMNQVVFGPVTIYAGGH